MTHMSIAAQAARQGRGGGGGQGPRSRFYIGRFMRKPVLRELGNVGFGESGKTRATLTMAAASLKTKTAAFARDVLNPDADSRTHGFVRRR